MSVEADFGLTGFVGQANNTQVSWDITWPGVIDQKRFVAVSFQTDFGQAEVVRVSERFFNDGHVGETTRVTSFLGGPGVPFQFAVVVMPNH
jgi:hypothetical protein